MNKLFLSKVYLNKYFLICISLFLFSFICFDFKSAYFNIGVSLTNFIIVLISIFEIFKLDKKPFSLNKMFFLFVFFFLGLAPIIQFNSGVYIWGGYLNSSDYLRTNLVIILILFLYLFIYRIGVKIKKYKIKGIKSSQGDFYYDSKSILIISLSAVIAVLVFFKGNIIALVLRGSYTDYPLIVNLIFNYFIRPIPVLCLIIYKLGAVKKIRYEFLLLFFVLFATFPTSMPRLQIASLYIPLLFIYVKALKRDFVFVFVIIFAVLFAFPFFNIFRSQYIQILNDGNLVFFDSKMFCKGHFDNYQNFARVLKYDLVTYGDQFLGVFFFFIPRSIWPDKPVNSGILIYEKFNLYFDNISVNYFAEGYLNFGYFGVILFLVILALINSRMDKMFWVTNKGDFGRNIKFSCYYLGLLGMLFFILRGALMGAYPIALGFFCSAYFVFFLLRLKIFQT